MAVSVSLRLIGSATHRTPSLTLPRARGRVGVGMRASNCDQLLSNLETH